MAKELPYFKFEPGAWDNGKIQMCKPPLQAVFINLCSMYWHRLGDMPYELAVRTVCKGKATALTELSEKGVIKVINQMICIDFLNEQLAEFENTSKVNSENAREGWKKRRENATPMPAQSDPNAIRGEERKEEKIKEDEKNVRVVADKSATPEQRAKVFYDKIKIHLDKYTASMLRDFYEYWTEMNDGGKKMRFEMQKVFALEKRLKTWHRLDQGKTKAAPKKFTLAELEGK